MNKIWSAMLYGNKKTKMIIYSTFIFSLASLCLVIAGCIKGILWLLAIAFLLLIPVFVMFCKYSFQETSLEQEKEEEVKEEDYLKQYEEEKIKQIFYQYKVKIDHKAVMIDSSQKLHISQCPAYIWVQHNQFHMLLLEREPRKISIKLNQLGTITYKKGVPANQDMEYRSMKKASFVAKIFAPYLPDYNKNNQNNIQREYKNLYVIQPDIAFTNTSAKHLFELLTAEFIVEDSVTNSKLYHDCFKEAHKLGILLKDNGITIEKYKKQITDVMEQLIYSDLSPHNFENTLQLMVRHHLITQEFADYYQEQKAKLKKKG